jgi:hypothetical protein
MQCPLKAVRYYLSEFAKFSGNIYQCVEGKIILATSHGGS